MSVYDLNETRLRSFARVSGALAEMEDVLRRTALDSPARGLIEGVIRRLKSTRERLEAGLSHGGGPRAT